MSFPVERRVPFAARLGFGNTPVTPPVTSMLLDDLMSLRDAAAKLGISYWAAYGRSARGEFGEAVRLGTALFFDRHAVEQAAARVREVTAA